MQDAEINSAIILFTNSNPLFITSWRVPHKGDKKQLEGNFKINLRLLRKKVPVFKFEMISRRMLPRGVRLQDNASALQVREVGKSAA